VTITSTSYGGRGLYWYASGRPNLLAALVPMAASIPPHPALVEGVCCRSGAASCCPAVWHVVGANDKPGMVAGHDAWDNIYTEQRRRGQRTTDYKYSRYEWAPPPRQEAYSYMTGHAPYELAWPDPALQEWMLRQRCPGCTGPSLAAPIGPDLSWKRSDPTIEPSVEPATEPVSKRANKPTAAGKRKARREQGQEQRPTHVSATTDDRAASKRREAATPVRDPALMTELTASEVGSGAAECASPSGQEGLATRECPPSSSSQEGAAAGTRLHAAARTGDVELAQTLLRDCASLTARAVDDKSRTPLHVAAHHGQHAIVELLLKHGAPVNAGEVSARCSVCCVFVGYRRDYLVSGLRLFFLPFFGWRRVVGWLVGWLVKRLSTSEPTPSARTRYVTDL
jgi:hypothetical protein